MYKRNRRGPFVGREKGYTLAELLVSVAIVSLAVLSIVAVLRKGSETTSRDLHRQRALAVIDSCFESPSYGFGNYASLAAVTGASVVIDPRVESNAGDNLTGTLNISVTNGSNTVQGTVVNYKRVSITVTWQEPEGAQAITLEKLITPL